MDLIEWVQWNLVAVHLYPAISSQFRYNKRLNFFPKISNASYFQATFVSKNPYVALKAKDVTLVDDESSVKFSAETLLFVDKYEIV